MIPAMQGTTIMALPADPISFSAASMASRCVRSRVDPRLVPREKAARRLGLTLLAFEIALPELLSRGFPPPLPVIGNFDLQAIDHWIDAQVGLVNDNNPEGARAAMMKAIAGMSR
jgi:hypothetical protein